MASILKVDEMQGVTSAGDITVTSEGGSATQSLQQGLCKSWSKITGPSTFVLEDSLNVSTLTDVGTGDYQVTYTNAMTSAQYGENGCSNNGGTNQRRFASMNSTRFASSSRMASYNNAGGIVDAEDFTTFAHGDLA